jgi:hypothetical protein
MLDHHRPRIPPQLLQCPQRPANPKADPEAQSAWKGGLTAALSAVGLTRAQTLGFGDEMRLGLIGPTRRVWAPVGVKVAQPLQYERQWCYLVRVVDPRSGRLWWSWTLDMTAASLARMVALWREAGIEAVVWDRAPAHQTATVHAEGVTLITQPPYSPELNPAERVVEAVRLHIEGRVYASLPEKYAAVHAFLTALDADPDRVRSLAGWRWIQDALAALPQSHEHAAYLRGIGITALMKG